MKRYAMLFSAALLAGCVTTKSDVELAKALHAQQQPTFKIECPDSGCVMKSMAYTDPRDRQAIKLPTNGWDSLNRIVDVTGSLVQGTIVPAAFAYTATRGFEALKGSGGVTTIHTANTSTANSGNTQTSTVGANSGANSGNSGRLAGGDVVDSTHAPTVVTQPPPVVVEQPAPVIVPAPAP